jgi:hypothetical protein
MKILKLCKYFRLLFITFFVVSVEGGFQSHKFATLPPFKIQKNLAGMRRLYRKCSKGGRKYLRKVEINKQSQKQVQLPKKTPNMRTFNRSRSHCRHSKKLRVAPLHNLQNESTENINK